MASRDSGNIGGTRVLHNSPGGGDPLFIHMLGVSPETRRRAGTGHELTPVEKLRIKHDKVSAQRKREGQRSEGNRRLVKEFEREHRRPPTYAEMLEILGGDPRRPGAGSVGGDTDFEDPEPRDLRRDFDFAALKDEIDEALDGNFNNDRDRFFDSNAFTANTAPKNSVPATTSGRVVLDPLNFPPREPVQEGSDNLYFGLIIGGIVLVAILIIFLLAVLLRQ